MKRIAISIALAATALTAPVQAQNIQGMGILALDPVNEGNTVLTLTGKSTVNRQADVAIFTAGVTTTGTTAEEALRDNAVQMQAVVAAARRLGITEKDIQTSQVSIVPILDTETEAYTYGYSSVEMEAAAMATEATADAIEVAQVVIAPKPPQIVGYRATNAVSIKQRKLSDFGPAIDALVKAGANTVDGPTFVLEASASTEEEARAGAIADARKRAEFYAAAAGLKVVRIIMLDEGRTSGLTSRSGVSNQFGFYEAGAYDGEYATSPVLSGELQVTGSIGMMFELAPQ